ncbi:D-2-hydroxyacid dehydrogenase [Paeniglutamicibacter cryotolerans]|uniref:Phosphoglycerate dehydrogenase-like enzyme n=1 Tax=Paeniglutamicibacter cryotolerans TaxID=670079 RepID=A0A839QFP2_9MICC|nr:D-2-hydroxyacid dehydrogenase [Paeniglutamicibacter cryotolerans]MBB2994443.1 phosphoglycerate dehydrogenase-like enzyme [Paeniglutamicibacter cryotolerans]
MSPHVLMASYLEPELVQRLRAGVPRAEIHYAPELLPVPGFRSDHRGTPRELDAGQLGTWHSLLGRAEVMFDFDWWQPECWRKNSPNLKWVQGTSAGIGARAAALGFTDDAVALTTAAGVHARALAEFVVAGLLHFVRDVPGLQRGMADRDWKTGASATLRGRKALIVGAGSIGREVARTLDFFGVDCIGTTRTPRDLGRPFGACVEFGPAALGAADIVVLACPLTHETRGLLGAEQLAAMKPGSLLVNIARGEVVDQRALIAFLEAGHLSGAVLDVAHPEPLPAGNPLWSAPNVLLSPHTAANVWTENERLVELFVDNLNRYIDGQPLRNPYDSARGY